MSGGWVEEGSEIRRGRACERDGGRGDRIGCVRYGVEG